jgi:L-serine dehydratase
VLYNSFADTGEGHGTKQALISGLLGMSMDDENLVNSFDIAHKEGIFYDFEYKRDETKHPNTAKIFFFDEETGEKLSITGISIGAGKAQIVEINGYAVEFSGKHAVLLVSNKDVPGIISFMSKKLEEYDINIAYVKITRDASLEESFALYKLDHPCSPELLLELRNNKHITEVIYIPKLIQ